MKNIHVIPTDKPSRLQKFINYVVDKIEFELCSKAEFFNKGQHIYITSDEEIKKGDWFIENGVNINKWKMSYSFPSEMNDINKKVILTTDPELLEDGVQAIDDEFLEWFVKNPSCESVRVNNLCYGALGGFADAGYKIIIPKEEPKQFIDCKCTNALEVENCTRNCGYGEEPKQEWKPKEGEEVWIKVFSNWSSGKYIGYDVDKKLHLVREPEEGGGHLFASSDILPYSVLPTEPKQETLDGFINLNSDTVGIGKFHTPKSTPKQETLGDFIKSIYPSPSGVKIRGIELGAKWQAERMYSEEEVRNIVEQTIEKFYKHIYSDKTKSEMKELWFEQFKKSKK
jgi:hypothetical protein